MRKSSAILICAIALGFAMFVPLKATAQGVTIYGPIMDMAFRVMVTPIQATAMATVIAVPITALIGAIIDALRAEFIGDGTAGIKRG